MSYHQAIERLERWQERFKYVQIEQIDFVELIDRYDSEETFFYCDPPYMDEGDDLYSHTEFDHRTFVECLCDADARWMVSYTRVPDELREAAVCIESRDKKVSMRRGKTTGRKLTRSG